MKIKTLFCAIAFLLQPIALFPQFVPADGGVTLLRCRDSQKISVGNSYRKLNGKTDIYKISADGKYFIARFMKFPATGERGTFFYYESATGRQVKSEKLERARNFISVDGGLLSQGRSELLMLDSASMSCIWKRSEFYEKPFYVHNGVLLTIGRVSSQPDNNVEYVWAYYLKNGQPAWVTSIEHEGGISNIYPVDDDHVIVVADELVKLNLKTGQKESFKIKNFVVDGKRTALGILAGVAMAASPLLTGYVIIPIPMGNSEGSGMLYRVCGDGATVTDLSSNLLLENNLYYFADHKELRCFDADLNVMWHTPLPSKQASHSNLFVRGDTLWMINSGLGSLGTSQKNIGYPFVAAFSARTGEQFLFEQIGTKRLSVKSVWKQNNQVSFLFADSIKTYHFATGSVSVSIDQKYKDMSFLRGHYFTFDSASYEAENRMFEKLDVKDRICLMSSNGHVCQLTDGEKLDSLFAVRQLYGLRGILSDSLNVLVEVSEKPDVWIIDKHGQAIYHIEQEIDALSVRGDYLFITKDDCLTILSGNELLEGCRPMDDNPVQSSKSDILTDSVAVCQPVQNLSSEVR